VDSEGNEIVPPKYDEASDFSGGYANVWLDKRQSIIDQTGKELIPFRYNFIDGFYDGMAGVNVNNKRGFIDSNYNEIVPPKYDYAEAFSEGLAVVSLNSKSGFIDKSGKEVIPLIYEFASGFYNGKAMVGLTYGGRRFYIDKTGNEVQRLPSDVTATASMENWAQAQGLSSSSVLREMRDEKYRSNSKDFISGCLHLSDKSKDGANIYIKRCIFFQNGYKVKELPQHAYSKEWLLKLPLGDYTVELEIDKETFNHTYNYKTTKTYTYKFSFALTTERPYATIEF
jgi:hypothetical protein